MNRYRVWGVVYVLLIIVTSPALAISNTTFAHVVLPQIHNWHAHYLAGAPIEKPDIVQQLALQALICNFLLILFSAVETFFRGRKTRYDIACCLALGAGGILNIIFVFAIFTDFNFLYFTLLFAALYVLMDLGGIFLAGKVEPENIPTFKYSLAFVDAPTFLVCVFMLAPTWISGVNYPEGFADGVGAAIMLFSGCAWTSLMVFYVAPRGKPPAANGAA